jgi:hypothetical protein
MEIHLSKQAIACLYFSRGISENPKKISKLFNLPMLCREVKLL